MKTILIILLFIPSVVNAEFSRSDFFQPLSEKDIILESVVVVLILYDWKQTKAFRKVGHREGNVALGEYPSQERVETLISLGLVSHIIALKIMPIEYREPFQMVTIFAEARAIGINIQKGF